MSYKPNQQAAQFRSQMGELYRKRQDPAYVKYAFEQMGYDSGTVDEELSRLTGGSDMQTVDIGGQQVQVDNTKAVGPIEAAEYQAKIKEKTNTDTFALRDSQSTLDLINEIESTVANDPSTFKAAVGGIRVPGWIDGTKSSDLQDKITQLSNRLTVDARSKIKGQGTITDTETALLAAAESTLAGNPSEEAFKKELARLRDGITEVVSMRDKELNGGTESPETATDAPQGSNQPINLNTPEDAAKWLQENPTHAQADIVKQKLESVNYDMTSLQAQQPQDVITPSQVVPTTQTETVEDDGNIGTRAADKIGSFLGIKKFGEGIGAAMFLNSKDGKELQKKAEAGDKAALDAVNAILEDAPSAKEVIGSALLTGLNAASGGSLNAIGKATTVGGKVAVGAAGGAAFGAAGGLEQDKDAEGIAKSTLTGAAVGAAAVGAGMAIKKIAQGGKTISERIYNSAVKPSLDDMRSAIKYNGKTLGRELLDDGIKGTSRTLLKKSFEGLHTNERKLQAILDKSDESISRSELTPFLDTIKNKLAQTPTPSAQKALQNIDETAKFFPDEFTLAQANVFKRNIYSDLTDTAYKLDPKLSKEATAMKALAKGLKELIEEKSGTTQVANINKELAKFGKLQDSVIDTMARSQRNNLAGVGTMGALIEKTLGAKVVKTYSASIINKASKILEAAATSDGVKKNVTKAMMLNALREASDDETDKK